MRSVGKYPAYTTKEREAKTSTRENADIKIKERDEKRAIACVKKLFECVVGKCFVVFYVFSFPAGVYVGTLNLIESIPGPSILTRRESETFKA